MKRFVTMTIVCFAVLGLVLLTAGSSAWSSQDKPIKLLFAFFEPPQGPYAQMMKVWAKELESRTGGRVKTQLSIGAALGQPGEFYDLTIKGICDMAYCVPAFGGPGKFPMSEIIGLPWVAPRGVLTSIALDTFRKRGYLDKEFSEVKLLFVTSGHGEVLYTKEKPVTSLADLKGLKIWGTTPITQRKIKLLGGIPVAMPMTDMYSALQKGVLDGAIANWQFLLTFKLSEVLSYATAPFGGVVLVAVVMNKNKWNELPPDVQSVIDDMADTYSIKSGQSWDRICDLGKAAFLKRGGKLLEWKSEDLSKINQIISPVWQDWIGEMEEKGLPGNKAVDDFWGIWKELGVNPPAVGYAPK